MKGLLLFILSFCSIWLTNSFLAQQDPGAVNCSGAVPGCTTPSFDISTDNSQNINDFTTGGVSNPTTNPNAAPGNGGCLLSGETTSTFVTITAVSSGTLEWSIQGAQSGCFDWIMWPYNYPASGGVSTTCDMLQNDQVAPVACNWNGACDGYTGMANPGNLPAGASQGDFEYGINVVAGESYLLCFSNYSGTTQGVNLDFFGSASVSCTPTTPDQTICEGSSATVDIQTGGFVSPSFDWLVTDGVSDTSAGTGVTVTPSTTTTYIVEITENQAGPNFGYTVNDTFDIILVAPPTPNAGVDQQVCLGTPFVLTGAPSDPANDHVWSYTAPGVTPVPTVNFSPNTTSNTPTVNVNQLGDYNFIYGEDNGVCPVEYDTVIVTISDLSISATSVSPSCQGNTDGEIHIDSPDAVEYSFDGGQSWVTDSFIVNAQNGSYFICARTATGCQKCINVNVSDPAPITLTVSNDTLICQNGSGYLWAQVAGGNSYDYHWDHTANLSPTQTVNPISNTTYTVFAESDNGCTSSPETITVSVRDPIAGTISDEDTVCPTYGTDVFATATGGLGAPYTFTWSTGDVFTGAGNDDISVTPAVTTTYTVTVTDGCESTPFVLSTDVRVSPLPEPEYVVLNPEQCEPAVFNIVNTTDPTMSQYVYWLVDNDQEFVNQDTITTSELWGGQYDIKMVVTSYEGCLDSVTFLNALNVKYQPEADFKYSPDPVTMFNTQVFFQNHSTNADTYQWYFNEGYPATSAQKNVNVQFPDGVTGEYEVMLIATSDLGCVDTMLHTIIVHPEVIIYAPNSFTPDGDEFNQTWKVHMEGIDKQDFILTIYNRWGEVMWESHDLNVGWDGMFQGNPLPNGTYIWTIRTKDILHDGKYNYEGHVNILR